MPSEVPACHRLFALWIPASGWDATHMPTESEGIDAPRNLSYIIPVLERGAAESRLADPTPDVGL